GTGEIEVDVVALLLDHDMDADRLAEFDTVIVDEALRLEAAVMPFGDCGAHLLLRKLHQAGEAGFRLLAAEFPAPRADALLAQTARAYLAADIAQDQFRRAAVGGDDALDLEISLSAAVIAHGRHVEAFVESLLGLGRARAGHRSADIALMRDGAAE